MTHTPRPGPRPTGNSSPDTLPPKPYELIPFPDKPLSLEAPAGHQRYLRDRLHGTLQLSLKVETAVHVSTGVAVMGSDINSRIPLIKPMVQGNDRHLLIQGSSLKGCVRAVYEAITNSTLAVITPGRDNRDKIPPERLPCRDKKKLCPASRVFGALDWQGLVEFNDARCEGSGFTTGFMPSLYRPRPDQRRAYFIGGRVAGRKFYYHAARAIDKGQNQGIAVQQAGKAYIFKTQLTFKNLTSAELGTLLVALGQDSKYPIALKIGGGKPIGMGTVTVNVEAVTKVDSPQALRDRYTRYALTESNQLTGEQLKQFTQQMIQAAHQDLIQEPQLKQLAEVLKFPTNRPAPSGVY
ncbi:CRISPR-associated protein [Leptothermofonsia sichuanensis E412]|uniref:RAMP superfamily CRISPR-associated protein n=1 Tax=Leptothermofonsia sichuanensis TaxID=2917832 RepID=UPI001CA60177|nr:RAMP superfamily CRISPR-associated protein [Leptothermofonsia sichuanensis]QZZ22880.1 CRISPR-associated protein [Leptothermofonsia sichuanensis E412]